MPDTHCRYPGCKHLTEPTPNCGRIDNHDRHPWRTPNMRPGVYRECPGTPTVTRAERPPT